MLHNSGKFYAAGSTNLRLPLGCTLLEEVYRVLSNGGKDIFESELKSQQWRIETTPTIVGGVKSFKIDFMVNPKA